MATSGVAAEQLRRDRRQLSRRDSLDMESNHLARNRGNRRGADSWPLILGLAFQSIGVVFGDVGTSPLYVFSSTFTSGVPPTRDDILGALSLIIYTLVLIPLVKYIGVVMRGNDNGNGGTFALYSLICRHAKVSQLPSQPQAEDEAVSVYETERKTRLTRAFKIREFLEGSAFAKHLLLIVTLLGTCAVIGDGVLTPAISVLSAVDGIQGKFPSLSTDWVAGISIAILVVLFCVQRYGTAKVGCLFAPCVMAWFVSICGIGMFNIFKHDWRVVYAANPLYILRYFRKNSKEAWVSLGGIVLCITGTEAMFADLGHFSVSSIRIALTTVVLPSLLAAYMGQGAYLMKFPEDVAQTFYKSIPNPVYWPMFVVAVVAAIIASQAMISASFSIIEQSQALGCFPRVKIVHTSSHMAGQVYVPEVNWVLMLLCIAITGVFKTTTLIGNAYGIAVLAVMLVTTALLTLIMLFIWESAMWKVLSFAAIFFSLELMYFSSNLYKFDQGGYIPVAFAGLLLLIMCVWHYVSMKKYDFEAHHTLPADQVLHGVSAAVVPGVAFVYTRQIQGVPPEYCHFLNNVQATHAVVVLVTLKILPVASVPEEERFLVRKLDAVNGSTGPHVMYRCVARYGYMEGSSRNKKVRDRGGAAADGRQNDTNFEEALMASLTAFILKMGTDHTAAARDRDLQAEPDVQIFDEEADRSIQIVVDDRRNNGEREEELPPTSGGGEDNRRTEDVLNEEDHQEQLAISPECLAEVSFLQHCQRSGGVTYLLGQADVQASPESHWLKRLVVNVLYDMLRRACREASFTLPVPHRRLVKVGMTYEI